MLINKVVYHPLTTKPIIIILIIKV
uniref:Uncharacterized protein n=1 Tax=Tetranychus urticae TaxID=32264 RepID=T1KFH4_TETUR